LLRFQGRQLLLDCGLHPGLPGGSALPFFDMVDELGNVELLLVTHFHLDHCAALPFLLQRTTFKGAVYMTHPTRVVYKLLLSDYVRVSHNAAEEQLFTEQDLNDSMEKIRVVHYHQAVEHAGIKFTALNAGHVLGAAQFLIEIGGTRILYTGDYSREEDRHLMAAEVPLARPDVLIVESTYGVQVHEPQTQREQRFAQFVADTVSSGGKCLIPVFALGRAQELLLLLEELWEKSPHLQQFPVYYASQLAHRALTVFSTYITYMNRAIRQQAITKNPFAFAHIQSQPEANRLLADPSPCVVLASPGMLQSGYSRQLLEAWCEDPANGVLITGYSIEGTLARVLLSDPQFIEARDGRRLARRCRVDNVSFSAHCDFVQSSEFIDLVKPQHVVLVHGERTQMARMHDALLRKYKQAEGAAEKRKAQGQGANAERVEGLHNLWRPQTIFTPENGQVVSIPFPAQGKCRVVGSLAEMVPGIGHVVQGILVRRDFECVLMDAADLPTYTDLTATRVVSRIALPLAHHMLPQFIGALVSIWSDVEVIPPKPAAAEKDKDKEKEKEKAKPAAAAVEDELGILKMDLETDIVPVKTEAVADAQQAQVPGAAAAAGAVKNEKEAADAASTSGLPVLRVCGRVTIRPVRTQAQASAAAGGAGGAGAAAQEELPADPRRRKKREAELAAAAAAAAASAASAVPEPPGECIVVEWTSGIVDDMIADSVAAVACQCCVAPWAVLLQSAEAAREHKLMHQHQHAHGQQHEHQLHHHQHGGKKPVPLRHGALELLFHALVGQFGSDRVAKQGDDAVVVDGKTVVTVANGSVAFSGETEQAVQSFVKKLLVENILSPVQANMN
jgi:cleavage and polyadenylation specificity factor subunit 3